MKNFKLVSIIFLFSIIFSFSLSSLASAQTATPSSGASPAVQQEKQTGAFAKASGLNPSVNIATIAAALIEAILGLLGVIFIILLIYAGFQWMTAEGDEEKVNQAKQTISRAIIGLAIVIAAYSITFFVFNALSSAAGGAGSGGGMVGG